MKRPKYPLHFFHKLMIGVLLVLSICFIMDVKPLQQKIGWEEINNINFTYLPEGDYVLRLTYQGSPKNNEIVVYTNDMTDAQNNSGTELERLSIEEGSGSVKIPLRLEQPVRNVKVQTKLDSEETHYISEAMLQSVQLLIRDGYFLAGICILLAVLTVYLGCYVPFERYRNLLMVVLLGIGASIPLFGGYICEGDDLGFHIVRLEGIYQSMKAGNFPVRINPIQVSGFGDLSATMYPQLFLYPFALLRSLKVSLMLSYKLLIISMNIACAGIGFYSIRAITGSQQMGCVMSVLYTFSMYRLTNIYYRAAVGESLAMIFIPLVMWGVYEVFFGNTKRWQLLVWGMTGILQSHVLSLEMYILFLLLFGGFWLLFVKKEKPAEKIFAVVKAAVVTILLNMSFLLPFLYFCGQDLQVFHMENHLAETAVNLTQMFQMFPAVGGEDIWEGMAHGVMPLSVGVMPVIGIVLFLWALCRDRKNDKAENLGKYCLVFGVFSLLCASRIFPWEKVSELSLIDKFATSLQFAWRFLGPATVFLAVVTAIGLVRIAQKENRKWLYGAVAAVLLCSTGFYFDTTAQLMPQSSDELWLRAVSYSDGMYMYSAGGEFQTLWLDYKWTDAVIDTQGIEEVEFSDYVKDGTNISVRVKPGKGKEGAILKFPLYYYPGYEIKVNGERVEVFEADSRVSCKMPEEAAEIAVSYRGLPIFLLGDAVTVVSLLGFVVYCTVFGKKALKNGSFHLAKRRQKS